MLLFIVHATIGLDWLDGGYGLLILFLPEHNNVKELMIAIAGALVFAFGRQYYEKKGMKNKER